MQQLHLKLSFRKGCFARHISFSFSACWVKGVAYITAARNFIPLLVKEREGTEEKWHSCLSLRTGHTCDYMLSGSFALYHTHKGTFTKTCKLLCTHKHCAVSFSHTHTQSHTPNELSRPARRAQAVLHTFKSVQSHGMAKVCDSLCHRLRFVCAC